MWLPRCLRPVGWMPEKMTIGRARISRPSDSVRANALSAKRRAGRVRGYERKQGVEHLRERAARNSGRIQQVCNAAQQIAEEPAAWDGGDVQPDPVELDAETQQVEVQRAEREVQDVADGRGLREEVLLREACNRHAHAAARHVTALEPALQRSDGEHLVALGHEAPDRVGAGELLAVLRRTGHGDRLRERRRRTGLRRCRADGAAHAQARPVPRLGASKRRPRLASPALPRVLAVAIGSSLLSLALVAPAPSYDPWAWLLWGREVSGGALSTLDGPAFKPLPVAVCALLAPLGGGAPWLWVALVRAAAAIAALLAFTLARRVAGGSRVAGVLGAAAVLLCGSLPAHTAAGAEPALVLALALGAAAAWHERRMRLALACGVGCALLRVEAWPFLALAGVALWRSRPQDRALLAALAVAIPAAWIVPELIGSGDPLRSGARAREPNPGQPALAAAPALAALKAAAALPLVPLWAGIAALAAMGARARLAPPAADTAAPPAALARAALVPAAAGAAWIAVVAVMAQAGFSGEPRYALPGAALIALSGAVGLVLGARAIRRAPAAALAAAALLVALAAAPRMADLRKVRAEQAYQWRLAADLADAIVA